MSDMSATIVAKSDQINAADLVGASRTITIKEVRIKAGDDQPVTILIEGDNKAFRPCKGVRRLLVRVWGPDANQYIGQSLTIYCDPTVTWAGKPEGGIRVSHMTGLDEKIVEYMRTSREKTKPYEILPLKVEPSAKKDTGLDAVLATLKAIAKPGNMDALGAAWKEIGPEARKALAAELPALKAACEVPADDVPFDAETGEISNPDETDQRQVEDDPGVNDVAQAAADRIIAEIDLPECNAVMDVSRVENREADNIAAMPEAERERVTQAINDRREQIRKELEAAKAGEKAAAE